MEEIGQARRRLLAARRTDLAWGFAGVAAALVPAAVMWGFTVDDALISVRYARHLASGQGYVFNAGGPTTDGVTPLPWPFVLAPFARGAPLDVLFASRCLGLAAWSVAAACLGVCVGRAGRSPWPLLVLAASLPVAAHGVSGMETAVATALATVAATGVESRPRASAALAGLAAALRPEMAPWASVIGGGAAWAAEAPSSRPGGSGARIARVALGLALALGPFVTCALARLLAFGRPAPLAVLAKPSDLAHGAAYAASACLVTATPLLLLAPRAWWRASRHARVLGAGFLVHVAAVVAVGGDWMPYARLLVPVAPSAALAAALLTPASHRVARSIRGAVALAVGLALFVRAGPAGRGVHADRVRLVEATRPHLVGRRVVAALDVGWVSAATEATLVDLAGLTDPELAALPGGHTSKRIDAALLLERRPDALLFFAQLPPGARGGDAGEHAREARFPRVVEARLAASPLIAERFERRVFLPLVEGATGYVLLVPRALDAGERRQNASPLE